MKTIKYLATAISVMVLASCSMEVLPVENEGNEVEKNPNLVEMTLTVSTEYNEDTKATFINYPKLGWEKGDKVSILGLLTGNQQFTADSKGNVSTFTGEADPNDDLYYGLYPYDENVTITEDGVFENVIIPAVQTATAGSFDPKAYVAIAKSEDKENLYFKGLGTFLKFNIKAFAEMSPIKTITVTGNNNEVLAGKAAVTKFNADGGTAHSNLSGSDAAYSVTLEGTFDTEKAYFMMVRPQPYTKGITVQVELEDGTLLTRSGSKQLFESGEARNSILTMVLDPKYFTEPDPFTYYNMGRDITVGGVTINKTENTNGMKVVANDPENPVDLYNYISNEGVYFLSATNGGYFKIAQNINISSNVYIIGDSNTTIKYDAGKAINFKAGTLAFKNVVIDAESIASNQLISNYGATKDTDNLIFDGCKILNLKYPLYAINAGGSGAYKPYTCKNITLVNSDVQIGGNLGNGIINLANTTSEAAIDVNFSNNIFYASSNSTARIINNNGNLSSYTSSLIFVNNTIFNLHSGVNAGLIHMAGASTVEFKNNLFDFYSINNADGTKYEYAVRIWKNTPTYNVDNNHYWRRDGETVESDNFISHGNGAGAVAATTATAAITSGKHPFTSNVSGAGATR